MVNRSLYDKNAINWLVGVPVGILPSYVTILVNITEIFVDIFITLSSNKIIPKNIKNKINYLLNVRGLNIKKSKTKFYAKKSNKSVTGIIIDYKKQLKLENKKRKGIIDLYKECIDNKTFSIEKLVKLNGKMNDARQVEQNIFPTISAYLTKHKNEIKEYNKEQVKKKKIIKKIIERKKLNNKKPNEL